MYNIVNGSVGDERGPRYTWYIACRKGAQLERRSNGPLLGVPCIRTHADLMQREVWVGESRCKASGLARHDVDPPAVSTSATASPTGLGLPGVMLRMRA